VLVGEVVVVDGATALVVGEELVEVEEQPAMARAAAAKAEATTDRRIDIIPSGVLAGHRRVGRTSALHPSGPIRSGEPGPTRYGWTNSYFVPCRRAYGFSLASDNGEAPR
jgi:hypothetical protein